MNGTNKREMSAIREAAADWVIQLSSAELTAAQKAEFTAWLRCSPVHVREYLRAESAWQIMEGAAREDHTPIHDVIREIKPGTADFPGTGPTAPEPGASHRLNRHRRASLGVAAAVLMAVGIAFGPGIIAGLDPNTYATQVGETRHVSLADGSVIDLNTRSRIHVRMNGVSRDVFLEEGEAFFSVAKDSRRPFRVHSDSALVRAIGTQFNVYRQPDQTIVTVVEGRVAVTAPASEAIGAAPATELTAGHRVIVARRSGTTSDDISRQVVDPARAVAWRDHRLIFENESLSDVVREFNRYNVRQLVLDDHALDQRRISGVFKANRPDSLVDFLVQSGDVEATDPGPSRVALKLRD